MRQIRFSEKEFYHVYNRGVDRRNIFTTKEDLDRFFKSIEIFNTIKGVGSLRDAPRHSVSGKKGALVNIIAYGVNPNHFHFIIEQVSEKGIEKFMHKLGMGYAKYFNTKYKRSGALFQGKFKAKLIDTDEYLLHLSAYINLNHEAHGRGHRVSTLARSSWEEYIGEGQGGICKPEIVLDQFKNKGAYRKFAESSLKDIIKRKISLDELIESGVELVNTN